MPQRELGSPWSYLKIIQHRFLILPFLEGFPKYSDAGHLHAYHERMSSKDLGSSIGNISQAEKNRILIELVSHLSYVDVHTSLHAAKL